MEGESVKLSRKELYDLIWSTPIHRLAGRYGLSDVGLAKVCRRMDIPRPPRGYWARIRWGAKPKQVPLPAATGNTQLEVTFDRDAGKVPPPPKREPPVGPKLDPQVMDTLRDPHPLVAATLARYASAKPGKDGLLTVQAKRVLDLKVSPLNLDRSLRLLDALIKSWEAEGLDVKLRKLGEDDMLSSCVCRKAEQFIVSIQEKVEELDPGPTEEEKLRPKWHWKPRREYRPTGELTVRLSGDFITSCTRFTRNYRDTSTQTVEERARRIWQAGVEYFEKREAHLIEVARLQAERAERQRQWQLEWQRREEERRQREAEAKRVEDLRKAASSWKESNEIRAFVEACRTHLESTGQDGRKIEEWCGWAQAAADRLDPLKTGYPALANEAESDDLTENADDDS
jgi:hypothetical protein